MKRREFTAVLGAGLAVYALPNQSNAPQLLRPKRLKPGDTVGLITPATPVSNPDSLQRVARIVEHFGLRAKWGRHVAKKSGYFGNPVEGRLEDLHDDRSHGGSIDLALGREGDARRRERNDCDRRECGGMA